MELKHFFSCLILSFSLSGIANTVPQVSLRDKIGQMLLFGFEGKHINSQSPIVKIIEENNLGGIILFDYDYRSKTFDKNIESPQQVKQLNKDLQYFSKQANLKYHRPQLPLLISVDYEGGKVTRLSEQYGFPPTLSAAEIGKRSFAEAESAAQSMTQTLQEAGFNLNFAPVLDVNVNPNNPIVAQKERSFSSEASIVENYASIFSRHFLQQKIQCVYKHFPGHGSSTQDSHLGFVDVTNTWQTDELAPYQDLLPKKPACGFVMAAHITNRQLDESGLPATLSHKMLTELLRDQLDFKGVIITDDMQMKAITNNYGLEQALVMTINAGADMVIFGNNLSDEPQDAKQIIDIIEAKVNSGAISRERIDQAYEHIVKVKQSL